MTETKKDITVQGIEGGYKTKLEGFEFITSLVRSGQITLAQAHGEFDSWEGRFPKEKLNW